MSAVKQIPDRPYWESRAAGLEPRIASHALRAGTVWVNTFDASEITTPFGGMKQSGTGRDRSLHAFEQYTNLKTTWIDLG